MGRLIEFGLDNKDKRLTAINTQTGKSIVISYNKANPHYFNIDNSNFPILDRFNIIEIICKRLIPIKEDLKPKHANPRKSKIINGKINNWFISNYGKKISKYIKYTLDSFLDKETLKLHQFLFGTAGLKHYRNLVSYFTNYNQNSYINNDLKKYRACHYYLLNEKSITPRNDWMNSFSITGKVYGNLSQTLLNISTGICPYFLRYLKEIKLERPIINRLELRFLLTMLNKCSDKGWIKSEYGYPIRGINKELLSNILRIAQFSTKDEILRASEKHSEHIRQKTNPYKRIGMLSLCGFIVDYPEPHIGNLCGLMDKSIEWHRTIRSTQYNSGLDKKLEVKKPPIDLPNIPSIKFLSTIGEIEQEGVDMRHCVASYAKQALRGNCYLFHIEKDGECATAEVSPDGKVRQCRGVHNSTNKASKYGERVLNVWGKKFPEIEKANIDEEVPF